MKRLRAGAGSGLSSWWGANRSAAAHRSQKSESLPGRRQSSRGRYADCVPPRVQTDACEQLACL